MAQWIGAFSGRTHWTKVEDLEDSLRKAVIAFKAAVDHEAETKWKAAYHLAERLHAARLKALRAKIAELREPGFKGHKEKVLARLEAEYQRIHEREEGVEAIMNEFGLRKLRD